MKLLKQFQSQSDAESASDKLRKRGILTFISSKRSNTLSRYSTGSLEVGLWAVLENQHEDAAKVLSGRPCKVRNPLKEAEMAELEKQASNIAPKISNEKIGNIIVIFFVAVVIAFIVFKLVSNNA